MTESTEQFAASLDSLTLAAFRAFCEDIISMFGNAAECAADSTGQGSLSVLKNEFKKLASVNKVAALGTMNGTFDLLLDQAGLFVLAGVFVMLPEKRVLETVRNGTLKDADYINDAIKEVGNLLVGSWDRIFREGLNGHKHFKQTGTFIGSIWDNPEESIGLGVEQPCRYVICKMKVDDFPEFRCAAVFPETLFESSTETAAGQAPESEEKTESQSEPEMSVAQAAAESSASEAVSDGQGPKAETPVAEADTKPSAPEAEGHNQESEPAQAPSIKEPSPDESNTPSASQRGPVAEAIHQLTHQPDNTAIDASIPAGHAHLPGLAVAQIMNPGVLWVDPEDTVDDVLRQMQQHNVGYVLAGRDAQIEGIISRSDIAAAISPYTRSVFAHWRRPIDDATLQIRVKWFMSRPVHTIRPETSLLNVMDTMMRHAVRGLPVIDANGRTVGLVTVYDVFAALLTGAGVTVTGRPLQSPPGVQ